jgi:hypothetical protein
MYSPERPYEVLFFLAAGFLFQVFFLSKVSASGNCLWTILVMRGTEIENKLEI